MTHITTTARILRVLLVPAAILAAGLGTGFAEELSLPSNLHKAARIVDADVRAAESVISVSPPQLLHDAGAPALDTRSVLVALPAGTSRYDLEVLSPAGASASAPDGLMSMRGQPVLRILVEGAGDATAQVSVRHDGNWSQGTMPSSLNKAIASTLPLQRDSRNTQGSYLMVVAPPYETAIEPLVEWKTMKGYEVVTVSTAETGTGADDIKSYIQNAYDNWNNPPQYVLLVGDVDQIPTFTFHGNPSDQPYVQLDGEDWIMDALIGRFSVENATEAITLVNKTINYERHPHLADEDWQTRFLKVAGNQGSTTPGHTVNFCGEQLQDMGFQDPGTNMVECPPMPSLMGGTFTTNFINQGVGMVIYRGWAYGSNGWDPPTFTVDNVGSLATTNMTPIVMSFVCLTGDITAATPCFGEAFIRQGSPDEPGKGAVAFIGNGEHWSHTRYNDAMAISIFEMFPNNEVTDLGTVLHAGKLRFMDSFPHELNAEDQPDPEESVEFYFHIYNLLGDPSLQVWRQLPQEVAVAHPTQLSPGATHFPVTVTRTADSSPVEGARVAVSQDGVLVGTALTDADGLANLTLTDVSETGELDIVVSEAGIHPYEGTATVGEMDVFLAVESLALAESGATNDGQPNPGENLALTVTLTNHGTTSSGSATVEIVGIEGPATGGTGSVTFQSLPAGSSIQADGALNIAIDPDAADGAPLNVVFQAQTSNAEDLTRVPLTVAAPAWEIIGMASADGMAPEPGTTTNLALSLRNSGSLAATAGELSLSIMNQEGVSLGTGTIDLPACGVGETITTAAALDLTLAEGVAVGTNLTFDLEIITGLGYTTHTTCAVVVGPVNVASPVGPDRYGYFAYDSADFDYPDHRPVYFWSDISTEMGGPGEKLDFPVENLVVDMVVDLPFTFRYYGQDYTQIRVSDNGWISFDLGTDYNFYNWSIPTVHGVDAVVAPFWDNLNPVPASGDDDVNGLAADGIYVYHDTDLGGYVVEWSRLPHYKPEILGFQTFQVILLDPTVHPTTGGDGQILFLYRQVQNNDNLRMYATVGIESPDGEDGLQLSYANINDPGMAPLQPGLAVRLTTEAPVRVPFQTSFFTARQAGGRAQLNWGCPEDRPVLGWHVDRVRAQERTRLTESALPGSSRDYQALGHQEGDTYVLTATHPYGVTSEPGRTQVERTLGTRVALYPAHPNPAHGSTNLAFALPRTGEVTLRVYDMAGRLVKTVFQGQADAGDAVKVWDGRQDDGAPVAGGIYFYRLETGNEVLTRKLTLVR